MVDLSEPAAIYQVDNVPTGLAAPASLITRIGAGMAQAYDFIFARPDALTYSKTGMLFGAQLAAGSTDFRFSEPEIQRMFTDYVHNCVVGDIMLNNKYTIGDLMNASRPVCADIQSSQSVARPVRQKPKFPDLRAGHNQN
ncbi:conjugal transfer protein TraG N-terminal domain-containing protein [Citrobacter freundii]|nr:conjugal transfer protein TraG N-terminal domain-containing protein [Citrobacter freundii]